MCKEEVLLTPVYASCNIPIRRVLWDGLFDMSTTALSWVVMGDFNVIVDHSEQVGCKALDPRAMEDFNDCLLNYRLKDPGYNGSFFSWTNGRISKRLDRVLVNSHFGQLFPMVRVKQLAKTLSDHAPLLIESCTPKDGPRGLFRFHKIWLKNEGISKVIEDNWILPVYGDPLYILGHKLRRLKGCLKEWNKMVFGNIFSSVQQAEEEVENCEAAYESSRLPADREALHKAKAKHLRIIEIQEDYLRQLSGLNLYTRRR
ncbi:hypothetical protein LIER_41754 [Lithospermum erythrorhizon]|uniref:Endonuclease/exonuclease/phosphatase domain-containing protein n=1 Tax=Lithospermum erythrorhizon TaxID=34254 RepID=A0AAV3RFN8_LITER